MNSLNEYILSALQEKNLMYFSFFLHHYEPQLNKRTKSFLGVEPPSVLIMCVNILKTKSFCFL